ncbi:hypothetical protein [Rhodovastum atsumiense]|uniref:Uncharacterized protein n=1 Tax=Rhodovastum atsumiense TaxID=504468 RepID=A0A5M6J230_9PROT|nr:hypothetical protein [Rhodovastum atsumiense]KAA5614591.1 hypothetical protein F1189_00195 [Rhodovastum atsumiense]
MDIGNFLSCRITRAGERSIGNETSKRDANRNEGLSGGTPGGLPECSLVRLGNGDIDKGVVSARRMKFCQDLPYSGRNCPLIALSLLKQLAFSAVRVEDDG